MCVCLGSHRSNFPNKRTDPAKQHISRPLDLHIYNHEYDLTRLVTITPSRNWGGSGALGCVLGYGALHRLPVPLNEPPQAPGETLFETVNLNTSSQFPPPSSSSPSIPSSNLLIPAEHLPDPSTTTTTPKHTTGGRRTHHRPTAAHHHVNAISPNSQMDEYFREGEAKSKELDHAPTANTGNLPPPPKMGSRPPPPKDQDDDRNEKKGEEGEEETNPS